MPTEVKLPNMRGVNRGLHILLVEDDDDDAMMLDAILTQDKRVSAVWRCRDGVEALEFLASEQMPDLVIADVNMPRKSGFSFLEEVRGSKSGKFLPVVMMTSSSQAVDYHKSLMTRANTFITKPNTYDELSRVLKKLIRAFIWQESLPTLFSAGEDRSALAASVTNSSATMH